jgi:hypothetical protein
MRTLNASIIRITILTAFMVMTICLIPYPALASQTTEEGMQITGSGGTLGGIGVLGGSLGKTVKDRLFMVGEVSFFPNKNIGYGGVLEGADFGSRGFGLGGGVQYMFPLTSSDKWVPYIAAGLSYIRFTWSGSVYGQEYSLSSGGAGIYLGGGARYSVSDRWGICPELTFHTGSFGATRLQLGLFYNLGE